jgi:hypothetical protein
MKWLCLIWDHDNRIVFTEEAQEAIKLLPWETKPFTNKQSYGDLVDYFVEHHHEYDHVLLISDGHWALDGIANQAFYTMRYTCDEVSLNHHSASLIDYQIKSPYKQGANILVEAISQFNQVFKGEK